MQHRYATWLFCFLFVFAITQHVQAQLIYPGDVTITGAEEIVFDWSADSCETEDIPDAPARFFRDADGKIQLIATHFTNYRMIGDDFNSLVRDCNNGPIMTSNKDHDPAKWNDHEWILGTYTTDGKTIHAIVHNEFHGHENTDVVSCSSGDYLKCWYNGLTYASSADTGRSYTQTVAPSHFVATIPYEYADGVGPSGIFGGSNIIYNPNDGYYYVLIHLEARGLYDWGTGIMRTQDLSDPTSWRAWGGEAYDVQFIDPHNNSGFDPADHVAKPIAANGALEKMHASLTWNTYFEKWMIVGAAQKGGVWGIYYSVSEDLINWTVRKKIMDANLLINPAHSNSEDIIAYPTIVDHADTSRNFEITGQNVHLYFTRWHITEGTYNRDLVRVPIQFSKLEVDGFEITGGGDQEDDNPGDGICNTASGLCSFRAALQESNARPPWYRNAAYNITFNMNFNTLKTITIGSTLPGVLYPVLINGFTQPDATPNTAAFGAPINTNYMVELNFDGTAGLSFEANGNTIKGLIINRQQAAAIGFTNSDSNVVQGMFLNVSADGTQNLTTANDGVVLESSSYNLIGDTTAAGRNLIVGGVRIKGPDAAYNRVEGNYIGTDLNGTTKLDQWASGVTIEQAAQFNIAGGANVKARNLISGNNANGVHIDDASTSDNEVLNNYIGVKADLSGNLGNNVGVALTDGTEGNRIGRPGSGNLIAGNNDVGVWVDGAPRNFFQGNYIGTTPNFDTGFGNGNTGFWIMNGSNELTIGGAAAGEGNTIAYNTNGGIHIFGGGGNQVKIWANSIFQNSNGLGIDFYGDNGTQENDDQDIDTDGPNYLQNTPVLTSAINGEVQINGTLNSTPNTAFRIEFFASDTCDPTGYGEGQTYLDAMEVTTDANGDAIINTLLTQSVDQGTFISATATDPDGNTSEFSNCVMANPQEGILAVSDSEIEATAEIESEDTFNLTISNTGNAAVDWTLSWTAGWIAASATNETIQPQTDNTVVLTFDASGLSVQVLTDTLTITNSNGQQADITIPVQFTVTETPAISVSADTIKAQVLVGGEITTSFSISNTGNGDLTWNASMPVDKKWGDVTPKNGTLSPDQSQSFNVLLDADTLTAGVYNTEVVFNSNDPDNGFVLIPVVFTVLGSGPAAGISPEGFSETLIAGDSVKVSLIINSVGTEAVTWTASKTASWISFESSSGSIAANQSHTLNIWLKSQGLDAAVHADTVILTTNDPNNPSFKVPIALTVNASESAISLSSDNFSTTVSQGDSLTVQLLIENTGTGALNWGITWNEGWLSVTPSTGTGHASKIDTVAIKVNSIGLGLAAFTDTLLVTSSDPNFPTWKVAVRMLVTNETPQISVSQDNLATTLDPGQETTHPIAIINNGNADLQWSLSWNADWIVPSISNGTLSPASSVDFSILVKTDGVSPGTYLDTLFVHSNDPATPSFIVKVYLTINEKYPVMMVSQDNLGSKIPQGTTHEHMVIISNGGQAALNWNATKTQDWVLPDMLSGMPGPGEEDTVHVVLSAVGLETGTYADTLMITSNDPNNAAWNVAISLIVDPGNGSFPEIVVMPDTLRAEVPLGGTISRTINIKNEGAGVLNFSLGTAFFAQWLVVDHDNKSLQPNSEIDMLVQMVTDTLPLGEHEGAVMVNSNDQDEPNVVIPVYVTVEEAIAQGHLIVLTDSVAAEVQVGSSVTQKLKLANIGTGDAFWVIDKRKDYLAVQPTTGVTSPGDSVEVLLNFDASNLWAGVYQDTIMVTQSSAPLLEYFVPFTLSVTGTPALQMQADSLLFSMDEGDSLMDSFTIWNNGTAHLEYEWDIPGDAEAWMTIEPVSGFTAPGDSTVFSYKIDGSDFEGGEELVRFLTLETNDPNKNIAIVFMKISVNMTLGVTSLSGVPLEYGLSQNFPNPFNPGTTIHYALPEQAWVSLKIYDMTGAEVVTLVDALQTGKHYKVAWNGRDRQGRVVSAGVYIYRITARGASGEQFVRNKKMIYLK